MSSRPRPPHGPGCKCSSCHLSSNLLPRGPNDRTIFPAIRPGDPQSPYMDANDRTHIASPRPQLTARHHDAPPMPMPMPPRHGGSGSGSRQSLGQHVGALYTRVGGSQDVSPLAINPTFPRAAHLGMAVNEALGGLEVPPTPPPESKPSVEADPATPLLDLTGQVRREGSYPQAHGGFADVWKGVWDRQPDRWVAVKVLRSRLDDPQRAAKMHKRLAHEVSVWKRLDHKHVLKLLGTVSDFGPYDSMVCPWLEQGSVSKYMERRGDLLSMADRLQLLCDVADGLNYLHENSIVHGDLTGSNILIDDQHHARLCDFGLSSIVVEFCGTTGLTSCIGGAVRWADAALYSISSSEDGLDEARGREIEGARARQSGVTEPVITTRSDIYSFGSVTLEILSGRIPYHYLRQDAQVVIELHKGNKPRRPAVSFVTDAQWAFIQRCWASNPLQRPDAAEVMRAVGALYRSHASLEVRRHAHIC